MENTKFRISNNKLGFGGGVGFLILILLLYVFSKFISDFEMNLIKYILIAFGVAIVVGIVLAIVVKENYFQLTSEGFDIFEGKKVQHYTFADFLGSNVVKHYMNGIYTGTTREIKIKNENGKPKSISCSKLNSKKFSELVSYLQKNEFKQTHNEDVVSDYFNQERFFSIPKTELIKNYKSVFMLFLILSIVCVIPAIAFTVMYILDRHSSMNIVFMVFSIIGVCVLGYLAICKYVFYKEIQSIPDHISFDNLTLAVDKDTFVVTDISNISMVPSSYTILSRDLVITTKDNKKHKYNFGKLQNKEKYNYKDYDALYKTMKLYCIDKNINFISELG